MRSVSTTSRDGGRCAWGAHQGNHAPPPPPPPPRTKWTRRAPHPVLIGHAASLSQVHFVACGHTEEARGARRSTLRRRAWRERGWRRAGRPAGCPCQSPARRAPPQNARGTAPPCCSAPARPRPPARRPARRRPCLRARRAPPPRRPRALQPPSLRCPALRTLPLHPPRPLPPLPPLPPRRAPAEPPAARGRCHARRTRGSAVPPARGALARDAARIQHLRCAARRGTRPAARSAGRSRPSRGGTPRRTPCRPTALGPRRAGQPAWPRAATWGSAPLRYARSAAAARATRAGTSAAQPRRRRSAATPPSRQRGSGRTRGASQGTRRGKRAESADPGDPAHRLRCCSPRP